MTAEIGLQEKYHRRIEPGSLICDYLHRTVGGFACWGRGLHARIVQTAMYVCNSVSTVFCPFPFRNAFFTQFAAPVCSLELSRDRRSMHSGRCHILVVAEHGVLRTWVGMSMSSRAELPTMYAAIGMQTVARAEVEVQIIAPASASKHFQSRKF